VIASGVWWDASTNPAVSPFRKGGADLPLVKGGTRGFWPAIPRSTAISQSFWDRHGLTAARVTEWSHLLRNSISTELLRTTINKTGYMLLGFFRHKSTNSSTEAVPTHITVSAAPQ
jgi:hypothetical protein